MENASQNTAMYMEKSLKLFRDKKLIEIRVKEQDFQIKQMEQALKNMKDPQ